MKVSDIFTKISTHQVVGIMLHDQMADAFAFLALDGFAHMHEHQYKEENNSMRNVHRYYIDHMDMLMENGQPSDPHAIPRGWGGYTRQRVDAETKRKAAHDLMERWIEHEKDTKKLYEESYRCLSEQGEIAAACMVKKLITDVDDELCWAKKLHLRLEAVDYDMQVIDQVQLELLKMWG